MNYSFHDESKSLPPPCPEITFCITCMGRLEHLKCTVPENIAAAERQGVEFVILNYSSPDGCDEWVCQTLQDHIKSGIVVYYRYDGAIHFHHAHAKNLAHRLARGRIVCNVDADNYIGSGFVDYILNTFRTEPRSFVRSIRGQVYGRMAFFQSDFVKLGGYDERMKGWGAEDLDLARRAKAFGLKEIIITEPDFLRFIPHGDAERVMFLPFKDTIASDRKHRRMSAKSIAHGKLTANSGLPWGVGKVTKIAPNPSKSSCSG